jgi:hypothetical protein
MNKPSLEEVQHYCLSRRNGISAQAFIDYYESVGWKIGKKPMVSWQACVRTWEGKNKKVEVQGDFINKHTSREWAEQ